MKSQVQMSFLNRAGCWTQLLALIPRFGPNFLGFLSLRGRRNPRLLHADFRGRKFVNPRTDVSGTCSDECELNGQVPQPWNGHWVLVENRLAQHWVVTSPAEPDKDAVGPDVHRATGLDESLPRPAHKASAGSA